MARRPRKQRRPRLLGKFHRVANPRDRLNPQSLRETLYDITDAYFKSDLVRAANDLKQALAQRQARTLKSTFSDNIIYDILHDRVHIKYYHLEGYARHLKIPASLLLLYSRLNANQHDGTPQYTRALIQAFTRILGDAESILDKQSDPAAPFTMVDLTRWADIVIEEEGRTVEQKELFPTGK